MWSQDALKICIVCDFLWAISILAACTYLVFWLDHSGGWYVLAVFLAACWNCKAYRSPQQIEADESGEM